MNKINLREVVNFSLKAEGNNKVTLLGVGPMSKTLIKASLLLAKRKDFPIMFIASRNQVDSKELGGGYVCNWDQKGFHEAIKEVAKDIDFDGLYYLCRDHGGPWQRDNERKAHLLEDEAMKLGKQSYLEDLINGFDLLHIDPTKDPYVVGKVIDLDVVLNRTIELIEYIENERKARGINEIGYEVGTEETNGGLTSTETYENFIKKLTEELTKKNLPLPVFIVGQTGTLTRLTENVGNYSIDNAKRLADVAKKYTVGLKEHNGDYLNEQILLVHPASGVTATNVAPEYGTVETQSYLKLIEVEEDLFNQGLISDKSNLKTVLRTKAAESERWRKWMVGDKINISVVEVLKDEKLMDLITEISGHYTFNNDEVKKEITTLYNNLNSVGIDGEKFVITKIQESLDRYVQCFNLEGLTSKLMN
ncbi:class II D-tagatose-bisphosphate aldolase non-catalytic subunit [Haloimpatiens sp. FM7315]|uniref:class II D-tagatose-bisphosphate aldolase non-catalytic subunit n=1 Tax=Haloimpatiens sp. FM7315 TaxID=3298609 RepID=UPI0035A34E82